MNYFRPSAFISLSSWGHFVRLFPQTIWLLYPVFLTCFKSDWSYRNTHHIVSKSRENKYTFCLRYLIGWTAGRSLSRVCWAEMSRYNKHYKVYYLFQSWVPLLFTCKSVVLFSFFMLMSGEMKSECKETTALLMISMLTELSNSDLIGWQSSALRLKYCAPIELPANWAIQPLCISPCLIFDTFPSHFYTSLLDIAFWTEGRINFSPWIADLGMLFYISFSFSFHLRTSFPSLSFFSFLSIYFRSFIFLLPLFLHPLLLSYTGLPTLFPFSISCLKPSSSQLIETKS